MKNLEAGVAQKTNNGGTFFLSIQQDGSSGALRVLPDIKQDGDKVALEVFSDTAIALPMCLFKSVFLIIIIVASGLGHTGI